MINPIVIRGMAVLLPFAKQVCDVEQQNIPQRQDDDQQADEQKPFSRRHIDGKRMCRPLLETIPHLSRPAVEIQTGDDNRCAIAIPGLARAALPLTGNLSVRGQRRRAGNLIDDREHFPSDENVGVVLDVRRIDDGLHVAVSRRVDR